MDEKICRLHNRDGPEAMGVVRAVLAELPSRRGRRGAYHGRKDAVVVFQRGITAKENSLFCLKYRSF